MEHTKTNQQPQATPGMDADELEAQSVTELPDREAMTVLTGGPAPVAPIFGFDELDPPPPDTYTTQ